jgi:hypothetical protein
MNGTKLNLPRIDSITQAKQLQRLSHETAFRLQKTLEQRHSVEDRATLCRALRDAVCSWDTARNAVRILKGKGLPTKVPEKITRRKLAASSYHVLDLDELPANVKQLTNGKTTTEPTTTEPETGKPTEPEAGTGTG